MPPQVGDTQNRKRPPGRSSISHAERLPRFDRGRDIANRPTLRADGAYAANGLTARRSLPQQTIGPVVLYETWREAANSVSVPLLGTVTSVDNEKRRKLREAAKRQPRKNGRFAEKPNNRQPVAATAHDVVLEEEQLASTEYAAVYLYPIAAGNVKIKQGDKKGNIGRLQEFAQDIADNMLPPLDAAGLLREIPDAAQDIISPESLVRIIADRPGGFSISGREPPTPTGVPSEGYCVAIHGTDLMMENQPLIGDSSDSNPKAVAEMRDFLTAMKPLLKSGLVWLGGFRRENGTYEVNITMIFPASEGGKARAAAQAGRQQSIWHIDHSLPGGGEPLEIDPDGGGAERVPTGLEVNLR